MSLIKPLVRRYRPRPLARPLGRRRGQPSGPTYSVSIAGLTTNPTYGATAQIGVELTASASGWTGDTPSSVAWQWYAGGEAISGATSATYTPVAGDDLANLYARATPADGGYSAKSSPAYVVRYAPPVAAGALEDQTYSQGSGNQSYGTGGDFTGGGLTFAVNTVSGVSINSASGVVTTDTTNLKASTAIVVTATNSGGAATSGYSLVVQEAPSITMTDLVHENGDNGEPDDLRAYFDTENVDETLYLSIATGSASLSVDGDDLFDQTGGTAVAEFDRITVGESGTPVNFENLTSASTGATKISGMVHNADGSIRSNVIDAADLAGALDMTPPTVSGTPSTNTAGTLVTVPMSEALFGTGAGVTISVGGSPVATDSVTLSGSNILVVPTTPIANGQVVTYAYDAGSGNIRDIRGNYMASASGSVTNNVPAASSFEATLIEGNVSDDLADTTYTVSGLDLSGYEKSHIVTGQGANPTAITIDGVSLNVTTDNIGNDYGGTSGTYWNVYEYDAAGTGGASASLIIEFATGQIGRGAIVIGINGATLDMIDGDFIRTDVSYVPPRTTTVTPSAAVNSLISCILCNDDPATVVWTGATLIPGAEYNGTYLKWSVARSDNVPVSAYDTTMNFSAATAGTVRGVLVTLAYSEAA